MIVDDKRRLKSCTILAWKRCFKCCSTEDENIIVLDELNCKESQQIPADPKNVMYCIFHKTGKHSKILLVVLPVSTKNLHMAFVQVFLTGEAFSQFKLLAVIISDFHNCSCL